MINKIAALLSAILITGCALNFEDTTYTATGTHSTESIVGFKHKSAQSDIDIRGYDSLSEITITSVIEQMRLTDESVESISIYLAVDDNDYCSADYRVTSSEWQGAYVKDFSVVIPSELNLDLSTSSGNIKASDILGTIKADVSSGDITLTGEGFFTANNSSGDVDISTIAGCDIDVSSGDVIAKSIGLSKINSTSGDVEVKAVLGTTVDATSGDVTVEILSDTAAFTGIDIDATSGDTKILLPQGFSAWLTLEATSGDISINGNNQSDRFTGAINGGIEDKRRIIVSVTSGDIDIIEY
jgi:hypothetical protein